ncbi:MAG: 50S ribosomal protein L24 [Deltaproteobacteria bacterium]|jgi:large subunit ribosomal protein L24|nr:50S ribosomal protein L24 [Deltaproteobacteria bacterium]
MGIKKGDTVKIITGKEKGKIGKVLRLDRPKNRVWIEKMNFVKRHQKPSQQHRQGGIVEKEAPMHISNVMYYDEKLAKATRIGHKVLKDQKVRVSKKSGETLDSK